MDIIYIIQVFTLTIIAFIVALLWAPLMTNFLYRHKLGKGIRDAETAPIFASMHAKKAGTPTMGGILIWGTLLFLISVLAILDALFGGVFTYLNFLSRNETLLPLGALIACAVIGLVDDLFDIWRIGHKGGGLKMRHRFLIYSIIAAIGAWWFYYKLGWTILHVPFIGEFEIGWWYIPFFIFIIVGTAFSVNEIDGLDGLAGGTLSTAFAAFGVIAFAMGKYDLAAFCGVIVGGLLAFLWFNINPARFFMGDTGSMSLGVTLGIIAMLTNQALLLPIIGFLFLLETMSVIIQLTSKKFFGRKVFLSAPIHHHFEAIGWSEPKIVMRFWVIAAMSAVFGLIIFLLDRALL